MWAIVRNTRVPTGGPSPTMSIDSSIEVSILLPLGKSALRLDMIVQAPRPLIMLGAGAAADHNTVAQAQSGGPVLPADMMRKHPMADLQARTHTLSQSHAMHAYILHAMFAHSLIATQLISPHGL